MPRDYKNAGRRPRRKRGAPGWAWMLAGLLVGLFIALLVYLNARPKGPAKTPASVTQPAPGPQKGKEPQQEARDVKKQKEEPIPPPPKPRFDFYTILPEMEVVIPEQEISGKPKQGVPQVDKPGTYVLQAGAFRNFKEAERLKASLALLGIQASVQMATINNETWYRVRIGPYNNLNELNTVRMRLRENAINAVLMKLNT